MYLYQLIQHIPVFSFQHFFLRFVFFIMYSVDWFSFTVKLELMNPLLLSDGLTLKLDSPAVVHVFGCRRSFQSTAGVQKMA